MKTQILNNLDNPGKLEKLYQGNKMLFKREFNLIFPDIQQHIAAQIWNERLNFGNKSILWGTHKDLAFVVFASLIAGLIAKIPDFTNITQDFFYPRNIAFIIFPFLSAYFAWKQNLPLIKLIPFSVAFLVSALFINLLPFDLESDTLILTCIHMPIVLWAIWGYVFIGYDLKSYDKRIEFLRYNGDLIVMTTILLIAGMLLTVITLGLFELIEIKMDEFYFKYVVIWGLAASPIVGNYLVQANPQLVSKVSPVIARVFTPLVLATLIIYLAAIIYTAKDPYNDREFLLIFNILLIGVMAIILFSVTETTKDQGSKIDIFLLLCLSIVTLLLIGIALSAILFRIYEWGITPNRLAVLGSNLLILINLILVTYRLFNILKNRNITIKVENSIAFFLPAYGVWAVLVSFVFPFLFNYN